MGKMKELFMKQYYPNGVDLEREYLIDDVLAQEKSYNELLKLWQEDEFRNPNLNTKIEVADVKTREIDTEKQPDNHKAEIFGS